MLICDDAGWHQKGKLLHMPENMALLPLPPHSPELNPMENVWDKYDDIVEACKTAWNWFIAGPDRINSIGSRDWACVSL